MVFTCFWYSAQCMLGEVSSKGSRIGCQYCPCGFRNTAMSNSHDAHISRNEWDERPHITFPPSYVCLCRYYRFSKQYHRHLRHDVAGSTQVCLVVQNIDETQRKYTPHVNCQWNQELKEKAIIPSTDAIIHPGTVVIKCLQKQQTHFRNVD